MSKPKEEEFNLKAIFEELDKIIEWFEEEDIDLEEGLEKVRHGMELTKRATGRLKEVENEFEEIKKSLDVEESGVEVQ